MGLRLYGSSDVDMHASRTATTRRGEKRRDDEEWLLTESRVRWKSATLTTVVASVELSAGVLRAMVLRYEIGLNVDGWKWKRQLRLWTWVGGRCVEG